MSEKFDEWAVLEIMGHQRFAGRVSEQAVGGASFVRVDVPESEGRPAFTKLFGAGSIYCITPCSEEVARLTARGLARQPMNVYDLPDDVRKRLAGPAVVDEELDDEDFDHGDR